MNNVGCYAGPPQWGRFIYNKAGFVAELHAHLEHTLESNRVTKGYSIGVEDAELDQLVRGHAGGPFADLVP